MSVAPAGILPDGRQVERITLQDGQLQAQILTLGAIVQDLRLAGVDHPLVLGCPDLADYLDRGRYLGAIVGRCANRIAGGRFRLEGQAHQVDLNFRDRHCLHGGSQGTDLQLWNIVDLTPASVTLRLVLEDGHMGFPGRMRITARIALQDDTLRFQLTAMADRATPCNLTHHGYFALDGQGGVAGQTLWIDADRYLPVDDDLIPTGHIAPVAGTPFDFRDPRPIRPGAYDHNLCLSDGPQPLREVARLTGREGLTLRLSTTACGLQLYDGAHLQDVPGLEGRTYGPHAGLALEAQLWPDAVNRPGFPDMILHPGAVWSQTICYRFST
ncbi:galactose mutarotase [Paracoccus gahaiensis]|uniref:Aldose 1-epimerase n=1 Tax=Paracoccus gahaiensis TaxID=1706839 RepID=A0A4U0R5R0_9RHOB|nr:aldose epimerase family protein [Paracoccus gahaiensis]TJZ90313.1 galactose mutarotase [Paracoccus gahaiensis]